jgi:hypothetical protein
VVVGAGVGVGVSLVVAVGVVVAVDPSPDWPDPLDVLGLVAAAPFEVVTDEPSVAAAAIVALPLFVSAAAMPKIATAAVPAAPAAIVRPLIRATARSRFNALGRVVAFMPPPCRPDPYENVRMAAAMRSRRPIGRRFSRDSQGTTLILPRVLQKLPAR